MFLNIPSSHCPWFDSSQLRLCISIVDESNQGQRLDGMLRNIASNPPNNIRKAAADGGAAAALLVVVAAVGHPLPGSSGRVLVL